MSETKLYYDKGKNNKPTFYHHAQTSTSQIDYILVSDSKMCTNYLILDNDESINTSVNRAVKMRTSISIPTVPKSVHQGRQPQYKLLWGEIKKYQYNTVIVNKLSQLSDEQDVNEQVQIISQALSKAEKRYIPSKVTRLKEPKWKASPEVLKLLQQCKDLHWKTTCSSFKNSAKIREKELKKATADGTCS